MFVAVLMGSSAPAADKHRIQEQFTKRLFGLLGGPGQAEESYRQWLRLSALTAPLGIEDLRQKLVWESAFDSASCNALVECGAGASEFFVIHLGREDSGKSAG